MQVWHTRHVFFSDLTGFRHGKNKQLNFNIIVSFVVALGKLK